MRRHGYSRSMVELIEFKEEERTSDRFEQGISGKKSNVETYPRILFFYSYFYYLIPDPRDAERSEARDWKRHRYDYDSRIVINGTLTTVNIALQPVDNYSLH